MTQYSVDLDVYSLILQSSMCVNIVISVVNIEIKALFGFFHIVFAILFSNLNFYLYFRINSSISLKKKNTEPIVIFIKIMLNL